MDEIEFDLRVVGIERWRTRALNKTEWTSVVRKARPNLKASSAKEEACQVGYVKD
jgi:hypothetical protein